jgi:cysteine desulfurase/selenocysteine lyase
MTTNRRDFLKKTALLTGAFSLSMPNSFGANELPEKPIDTEEYWNAVRKLFPLRSSKIYLNNGTMGPSPYPVLNEVQNEMLNIETQGRYGGYEDYAINSLSKFLGSKDSEISLMRNVTEGINVVCWGLKLKKGDEVIISSHEHVGHATPWLNRAKLHGIKLKVIHLGKTAEETLNIVKQAITKRTKVISLPHIPCTIGQVLPVKEICKLAKDKNIFSLIDGAHPPGMLQIDLKDIGCDFYAGCCHKWMLGPKGTGFLFVSEEKRNKLQAYYGGGGFDTGWDMLTKPPILKGYVDNGHRYFYGTQNAALFKGIEKCIEFQNNIGTELIEKRVKYLSNYLQENLMKLNKNIDMLTPTEAISKAAQISFKIKDKSMSDLHNQCTENNIVTRFVAENEINCLRVSTHIYNNTKEIDAFLKEVDVFLSK